MKQADSRTRGSFLKTAMATGAGLSILSGLRLRSLAAAEEKESKPTEEKWLATTCQGCTSWCAVEVQVVDGRATKVRGNSHSKVNIGKSCVRSHLALQQVYDPDRVKVPMKRTNPQKGREYDPGFVPITWDEALDTIADKILELRENNETHKYLLMRGRYSYMRDLIYDRMTKIIGSPNNISHSAICAEAEKFGPFYTEGFWGYRQYDVLNSDYLLLWGADPLAANRQVSYYGAVWGEVAKKAEVAVVDPRLSATAAKAGEWLPVKPGADGALAIYIAHHILVKGLWHKEFVGNFRDGKNRFKAGQIVDESLFKENHTHGLVKWWNLELKGKTLAWAAAKTDLSEEQITRVADGYAGASRPISWVGGGPVMQIRGAYASMACHALNGLKGAVDNVGGTLKANSAPIVDFPAADEFMDDVAKKGKKNKKLDQRGTKEFPSLKKGKAGKGVVTNRLADGILSAKPYDVKVAIGYFNNFAFSCPETSRWYKALEKIPFLAHITTNASELTWFADIVLPAGHHMFEKFGFTKSHANGYRHVPLLQPVIKSFYDVKMDESEIPWMLAERLAKKGFPNLLDYYRSIKDPETGKEAQNEKEFAEYSLKFATQKLWDPKQHEKGDTIAGWPEYRKKGVWNSNKYSFQKRWREGFKTKTKKFEFYSETLKAALEGHASKYASSIDSILELCKYEARGELAFVPHYEEPLYVGDANEYPFIFVDYKSRLNREGRSTNTEWYYDFKDIDPGDERNADVAKINPLDARKLGIDSGDTIKITSAAGEIECTAKLWEGVKPGTVAKAYGQGHWAYGSLAAKEFGKEARGANNNDIIPAEYDRLSGSSAFYGVTRVRIEKTLW